ncbi:MAG: cyclic pyranopterin monophosphate synthase MoaC [Anaerovoracaceae bacterium]
MDLTHFDEKGNARMVDVTDKNETERMAAAAGKIKVSPAVFKAVSEGSAAKGDVLTVATTAGIAGAKKTWELIPMCHIVPLTGCTIEWKLKEDSCEIECRCTARCTGKTGVEMEALTGVSAALLTVYDMCKAIDKTMEIGEIRLLEKDGGKSGHFRREV